MHVYVRVNLKLQVEGLLELLKFKLCQFSGLPGPGRVGEPTTQAASVSEPDGIAGGNFRVRLARALIASSTQAGSGKLPVCGCTPSPTRSQLQWHSGSAVEAGVNAATVLQDMSVRVNLEREHII